MGPGPTLEYVMDLRDARDDLRLSIADIMALLKSNGEKTGCAIPSESSVRSVLNGDLDKISGFSYESTLLPLNAVLRPQKAENEFDFSVMLDILRVQEETIRKLTDQLIAAEAARHERCWKCEQNLEIYKAQIKIKDKRMERKDRWIAQLLKLPIQESEDT